MLFNTCFSEREMRIPANIRVEDVRRPGERPWNVQRRCIASEGKVTMKTLARHYQCNYAYS